MPTKTVTKKRKVPPVVRNKSSLVSSRTEKVYKDTWWFFLLALAIYFSLSLISYHPEDPSWTHSASHATEVQNLGGTVGAYLSDIVFFMLGFSAWWIVGFCLLSMLWGFRIPEILGFKSHPLKWSSIIGFIILILSSAGFEAIVLQGKITSLSHAAGGTLGESLAHLLMDAIGQTGGILLLVTMITLGFSLYTGLSLLDFCERIGEFLENVSLFIVKHMGASVQAGQEKLAQRKEEREYAQAQRDALLAQEEKKAQEALLRQTQAELQPSKAAKVASTTSAASVASAMRAEPVVSTMAYEYPDLGDDDLDASDAADDFQSSPKPIEQATVKLKQAKLFAADNSQDLPGLSLLDPAPSHLEQVSPEVIEHTSRLIEKKLAEFGVAVKVVASHPGPVITRYEIDPAVGVKGSQIVNLMRDLARALGLVSIRIVETIPNKTYMGLELPNAKRQMVSFTEVIGSAAHHAIDSKLALALGKDISGAPVSINLAKAPHMLVAGTTGSGKSVAINSMILSLLFNSTPKEVRLIMVDPKMLELSVYEGIPHLLAPVVTDMKHAANALTWCVNEMERRYRLMSKLGVRNLAGYNEKIEEAQRMQQIIPNPFSLTPQEPEPLDTLPMIVVVIDELADLMMVAGKKVEELIARLAQKARAAGIHLILATQRPSVDVITGLIKANIPTRIAFQVSSKIDSRTILDQMGAEALLGQGDMLFLPPGSGYPQRVHGAFVSDEEVHRVVDFLKLSGEPDYVDGILTGSSENDADGNGSDGGGSGHSSTNEADALYDEAVALVLKSRKASISSVQRQLRIGYNRAARLIEDMEAAGLVSPMEHNGNRTVLAPPLNE